MKEMPYDFSKDKWILIRSIQFIRLVEKFTHSVMSEWGSSWKWHWDHPPGGHGRGPRFGSRAAVRASGDWRLHSPRSLQAVSSPTPGLWPLQKMGDPGLTEALPLPWGPGREENKGPEPQTTSLLGLGEPIQPTLPSRPLLSPSSPQPPLLPPSPVSTILSKVRPEMGREWSWRTPHFNPTAQRVLKQGNPKA